MSAGTKMEWRFTLETGWNLSAPTRFSFVVTLRLGCWNVLLSVSQRLFFSMLTIFLNFSLVAMSSGVSPSWKRERVGIWMTSGNCLVSNVLLVATCSIAAFRKVKKQIQSLVSNSAVSFCTYIVLDFGVTVSFQQQRNQAITFPLTGVMKSCVPLLHTKHTKHSSVAGGGNPGHSCVLCWNEIYKNFHLQQRNSGVFFWSKRSELHFH